MNYALRRDMVADAEHSHDSGDIVAPLPRISIQVFTDTPEVAQIVQSAAADRRMAKAHVKIQTGGAAAAVEAYRNSPTPNVIVIETRLPSGTVLEMLDELAGQCDAGTRVIVIGHVNDVLLYRDLMRRGVSEYLIAPISLMNFIKTLSELFGEAEGSTLGRTVAVVGTKGGVGSSTIAHNLGYTIANQLQLETVICDFDLAFGTAGLDFNQDPPQGLADAANDPDRVDAALVDRLMTRCAERLSILAAPATLERTYDFAYRSYEPVLDLLRRSVPNIIYDVPHIWSDTMRQVLLSADEIIVVAVPDLANLRNAKNMIDGLVALRKHDRRPHLVMNQVGMPRRPEIAIAEFAKAVGMDPIAAIPFDAQLFGTAANNGQMLADVQSKHKAIEALPEIMRVVTGKHEGTRAKKANPAAMLQPLLAKLMRKKA